MFSIPIDEALSLDTCTKLDTALKLKNEGVDLFRHQNIQGAFDKFSLALKYTILIEPPPKPKNESDTDKNTPLPLSVSSALSLKDQEEKTKLQIALYNNLANCHFLKGNWESTISLSTTALQLDPLNLKALFRRGSSLVEIQEYDSAKIDLVQASKLDPSNKAIQNRITILNKKVKEVDVKCGTAMKKMFT